MFNPAARIERIPIGGGRECLVVDEALAEPERWVELAAAHRTDFEESPHNAYPGLELRMPDALSAHFGRWFDRHARALVGARRTLRQYARLALATRRVEELEPRQWIPHRDRLDDAPDRCVGASVLYLFRDPALGGTAFFARRRSERDTAILVHESGQPGADAFTARYGIAAGYPTCTNDWFEKTATIEPRWNRLVVYDGGNVFHASDIGDPSRLSDDPRHGRLTLNGFFVCRKALE